MAEPTEPPPLALIEGAALFLDFDGTLIELAEAPDAIDVPGELHPLLERLAKRLQGRLGIVSGRSIEDLDRHLTASGLTLSGSHGAELRRPDGSVRPVEAPSGLMAARAAIRRFTQGTPGLLVEEKPTGIALHYRQAPERAESVVHFMAGLAEEAGLSLLQGKMVAELRPQGADKGTAIRAMMTEPPFAGARPLVMGDDVTDEDGFRAAAEMGGAGILVGSPRPTAAVWRLEDVAAAGRWLQRAAEG